MHIENLSLINFKNYSNVALQFSSKINCILGLNGSGKTNILDAIHYLSMTKSAHNSIDSQNVKFEEKYFSIRGRFLLNDEELDLVCYYQEGAKKSFKVNKKDYNKLSDHIGRIPSVLITPNDTDLIREGSDSRRKFIDAIICQIDREYLAELIRYNSNLKQRNGALKKFNSTGKVDQELLNIYDAGLIECGTRVYEKREKFVGTFDETFIQKYSELSDNREEVDITYQTQFKGVKPEEELKRFTKKDIISERTNFGVHKDDFIFKINGKPVKKFGSQGQQKTFATALKISQYDIIYNALSKKPLLLLDDIFDKLDNQRIEHLLNLINSDYFGQVFITDASEKRTRKFLNDTGIEAKFITIKDGTLST